MAFMSRRADLLVLVLLLSSTVHCKFDAVHDSSHTTSGPAGRIEIIYGSSQQDVQPSHPVTHLEGEKQHVVSANVLTSPPASTHTPARHAAVTHTHLHRSVHTATHTEPEHHYHDAHSNNNDNKKPQPAINPKPFAASLSSSRSVPAVSAVSSIVDSSRPSAPAAVAGACIDPAGPAAQPPKPLGYCSEFNGLACCSNQDAMDIASDMSEISGLWHTACPNCVENIRQLKCTLSCSPRQSFWMRAQDSKITVTLCKSFCQTFFDSCKSLKALVDKEFRTYGEKYKTAEDFCKEQIDPSGNIHVNIADSASCMTVASPQTGCGVPAAAFGTDISANLHTSAVHSALAKVASVFTSSISANHDQPKAAPIGEAVLDSLTAKSSTASGSSQALAEPSPKVRADSEMNRIDKSEHVSYDQLMNKATSVTTVLEKGNGTITALTGPSTGQVVGVKSNNTQVKAATPPANDPANTDSGFSMPLWLFCLLVSAIVLLVVCAVVLGYKWYGMRNMIDARRPSRSAARSGLYASQRTQFATRDSSNDIPLLSGWLEMYQTGPFSRGTWERRWFIVYRDELWWYKTDIPVADIPLKPFLGKSPLALAKAIQSNSKDPTRREFEVTVPDIAKKGDTMLHLRAKDEGEMKVWVDTLQRVQDLALGLNFATN
eukprot:GILK01002182.1.p1 GENE.GILK01002182.1~~GILK01002182.1.p1  ORF type:complete len:659 (-),score=97.79 GILK01002182.1:200-2176(-)